MCFLSTNALSLALLHYLSLFLNFNLETKIEAYLRELGFRFHLVMSWSACE